MTSQRERLFGYGCIFVTYLVPKLHIAYMHESCRMPHMRDRTRAKEPYKNRACHICVMSHMRDMTYAQEPLGDGALSQRGRAYGSICHISKCII